MRVTMKSGTPPCDYTNQQWQSDLEEIKMKVEPSIHYKMTTIRESSFRSELEKYHGKTLYQYYCSFINDVLAQIRKGECAYCYYVYQVVDVLRFERDVEVEYVEKEQYFSLHHLTFLQNT